MKVGIIDPSLFTLSYDRHLCAALHAAGVDVTLCGRTLRAVETPQPHAYPFTNHCYPWTERGGRHRAGGGHAWLKALEHVVTGSRLVAEWRARFDVLHFQWSPLPAVDRWHWRSLARDRAVIFTVHDTTPFLGRPTSRWQQLGWRHLLDAAHGLIVHTEHSRRELVRVGIAPDRIDVVPHGPLFPVGESRPPPASVPVDGRRTLLVFGEIKPYKGIDVLLRALARLPRDVAAGWRLVIAGRPRCDLAELRALATRSRVPVDWRLEYVPDAEVGSLFASAELIVFPYRQVDASGALMLALPFGVPIVASRVGVFRELLENGVTGLLATPGDDKDLATALTRGLRDGDLRAAMRRNLADCVRRVWSWSQIARAHLGIYHRHLQRAPHRTADGLSAQPGAALPEGDISPATEL